MIDFKVTVGIGPVDKVIHKIEFVESYVFVAILDLLVF